MKFGFIGCGKMAGALVRGAISSGAIAREAIIVTDCMADAATKLAAETGVHAVRTNAELAAAADVLLLCVKPADAIAALRDANVGTKLVISIVAGLPIAALQEAAGAPARIIRVMPNTAVLVHKGAAAYALGKGATPADADLAEKVFRSVGTIFQVKEDLLDVVTGLSGSGPAYVYLVIEALADGGVLMGLPRDLALKLAAQTVAGAAEMVLKTGDHPAALRDMVTSPGGTTIAGLEALEARSTRAAFVSAVRAGTERSRALGGAK